MAEFSRNFKNCRVMVRDIDTGKLFVDTVIEKHDVQSNIITLAVDNFGKDNVSKVVLVIFTTNNLLEFNGTVRRYLPGAGVEVALYGQRIKNDRDYQRYEMEADGKVDTIYIGDNQINLRRGIPVRLKDISASGILFSAGDRDFNIGDQINVKLSLKGTDFSSEYEIVRTQKRRTGYQEYGCRRLNVAVKSDDWVLKYKKDEPNRNVVLEVKYRYLKNHELIEEKSGYKTLLEDTKAFLEKIVLPENAAHPLVMDNDSSECGRMLLNLVNKFFEITLEYEDCLILNFIHIKCIENEKEARHCINSALIAKLLGRWIGLDDEQMYNVIKCCFLPEIVDLHQLYLDDYLSNVLETCNLYEKIASHPFTDLVALPLTSLEQMYNSGKEKDKSVRGLSGVLAENILKNIMDKQVIVNDGSIGKICFIPTNDISHPLIRNGQYVYQVQNPWRIIGFFPEY